MLAAYCSTNNESSCAKLLGTATPKHEGGLISDNVNLISSTPLGCELDSCSFYNGPSDEAIMAFCESSEASGSIAYGGETAGSIAFAGGGETAGSIASSSCGSSYSGCSSGGSCSYSC